MKIDDFFMIAVRYRATALALFIGLIINPSFAADEGYLLNKGDKLRIEVWQEESLQREVMVSPDGTISFPLIGNIPAAGQTTGELKALLRERLAEFIPEPEVNISLLTVEGNAIYIIGEVTRPGTYVMQKHLDVMQALSLAGGLTIFAAKNDIHVVRRAADGRSTSIPFRYDDVEDADNLDANILLQSGDTVIVP